jgi:hypothetical protein
MRPNPTASLRFCTRSVQTCLALLMLAAAPAWAQGSRAGDSEVPARTAGAAAATYRWATFQTYDQTGWAFNASNASGDASLLGGIAPSMWSDGNAVASDLSPDKEVLRTLFTNKGYAKDNAMVMNENFVQYSSTNGKFVVALFRLKNITTSAINWAPSFYYSAFSPWSEMASVTLNGNNTWSAGSSGHTTLSMTIPPGRVSTIIFASASGVPTMVATTLYVRNCVLAFDNNALLLPPGLRFVDDLDTATGGWDQ